MFRRKREHGAEDCVMRLIDGVTRFVAPSFSRFGDAHIPLSYSKRHRSCCRRYRANLELPDDTAARNYGQTVIDELNEDEPRAYFGWTMDIKEGERLVVTGPRRVVRLEC